jgi:proteasome lid subunit RPN8/RPN11
VKIDATALEAIKQHATLGYPYEICGMLVARKGSKNVIWTWPTTNASQLSPEVHYSIEPKEHQRIEKELDRNRLEIVGYYHSHPDHGSYASNTDRIEAWPKFYYVVASCVDGVVGDVKVFVKPDWDAPEMPEEPLEII